MRKPESSDGLVPGGVVDGNNCLAAWRSLGIDCFADRNSTLLRKAVTGGLVLGWWMKIAWRSLGIDCFADRNSTLLRSAESSDGLVDEN